MERERADFIQHVEGEEEEEEEGGGGGGEQEEEVLDLDDEF